MLKSIDARLLEQPSHLGAPVEHSRLDGVGRGAENSGDFIDRLVVVVDEVKYLAMGWRQLRQAFPDDGAAIDLDRDLLRIVRRVGGRGGSQPFQRALRTTPAGGDGLVPGERRGRRTTQLPRSRRAPAPVHSHR